MTDDVDAWLVRLPKPSLAEQLAELHAAREAAAAWMPAPTTIPAPDFPYPLRHPLAGTVRFSCSLGCGWFHDEHPGVEAAIEPLIVPADPDRLSEALTARRMRVPMRPKRVSRAIADHFEEAHPGR